MQFKDKEQRRLDNIADQKRKWMVLHFTKNGKIDKRRKPGRPWDPSLVRTCIIFLLEHSIMFTLVFVRMTRQLDEIANLFFCVM